MYEMTFATVSDSLGVTGTVELLSSDGTSPVTVISDPNGFLFRIVLRTSGELWAIQTGYWRVMVQLETLGPGAEPNKEVTVPLRPNRHPVEYGPIDIRFYPSDAPPGVYKSVVIVTLQNSEGQPTGVAGFVDGAIISAIYEEQSPVIEKQLVTRTEDITKQEAAMSNLWYEVLEKVRHARRDLGDPKIVWFRGHSSGVYPLVPSLHRWQGTGREKERELFAEFERSASRVFEARHSAWETLFDMQHYGVPTRLLDWTEALGIAVAFAVLDHHPTHGDAAIWVLDPDALNRNSGISGIKEIPSDGFDYKDVYWDNKPFAATYPIAIAPRFQNDRMFAQKGTFTVHGSDARPLEEICPKAVIKIHLPEACMDGAMEFLDFASINAFSLYPDIVGIASHIRRKHFGS